MIALDTNILMYAWRQETTHYRKAADLLAGLAQGSDPWALVWPCVYEFVRVVTHPKVFSPPSDPGKVLGNLQALLESPSVSLLGEGPAHPGHMSRVFRESRASGNLVHDAHIAALLLEHGVTELYTTDRDFSRFSGLRVRDTFA